jgi:hypothetical protein
MAFAITNNKLQSNVPGLFMSNQGSTAFNQIASSATTTSTNSSASSWQFADYTSTEGWIPKTTQMIGGGIGDFNYPHQAYRALVFLKSVSGFGTATSTMGNASLMVTLECATSTAAWTGSGSTGQTNAIILDSKMVAQIAGTSTSATICVYLFGQTPLVTGAQFAKVGIDAAVGTQSVALTSTAIDVIIEGLS